MIHPACSLSLSRLSFGTFDVVRTPRITFRSLAFLFVLALKIFLFETFALSHRYSGSIPKRFGGGGGGLRSLYFFWDEFDRASDGAALDRPASFTDRAHQVADADLAGPN